MVVSIKYGHCGLDHKISLHFPDDYDGDEAADLAETDAAAEADGIGRFDWDAVIIAEDREILESTDPDAIVDISRKIEKHMPSGRPAC